MPSSARPLKLACFSPLPPVASGIADYTRDLLPHLDPWAEVHLYVDDYRPNDPLITGRYPTWNYRDYPWRREYHRYDATIYHMGNNPYHRYLYPYVSRYPGVVVLHDLVLHHLLAGTAVENGQSGLYFREMAYVLGVGGLRLAWEVLLGQREAPFFEYPLCQRVLQASLGIIVHSQYLKDEVQRLQPDAPVAVVPMGIPLPPDPGPPAALRARLGLPADAFLVASFGQATYHKRIPVVLRAFARLVAAGFDAHYMVVGDVVGEMDLQGEAQRLEVADRLHVLGYVAEADFNAYLHAVDVCVNLRYPTAGETSASVLRCMAAGRATIVSDVGASRDFPDTVCFKIPVDGEEEGLLAGSLLMLASRPDIAGQLGRNARKHVAQQHRMEQAAQGYIAFIQELRSHPMDYSTPTASRLPALERRFVAEMAQQLQAMGLESRDLPLLQDAAQQVAHLQLDSLTTSVPPEASR